MADPQSSFEGTARFEVLRHLGSGGMGSVYQALDRQSGARLAIKTIERASGAALYQLKQEFRALADIRHPNLVQLFELISDGERWFFTMELVDGVDFLRFVCPDRDRSLEPADSGATTQRYSPNALRDLDLLRALIEEAPSGDLERFGVSYDEERLRASFRQLCEGIEALHRAKKVHRDIKPPNVLVTKTGRVVLLDFGLVEDLSGPRPSGDDGIQGTVGYMSPEQAGQKLAVPASDWYAAGVILFEALTGQLPFDGTVIEVLAKKLMGSPVPPSELEPNVAPDLSELCFALLARDPDERPLGSEILQRLGVDSSSLSVSSAPPARGPFVGRDDELAILHDAWRHEPRTEAVIAVVGGPSGIGKTALIEHFMDELSASSSGEQTLLLKARCYERETLPFKAFDAIVDSLSLRLQDCDASRLERLIPSDIHYLSQVFPVLRRVGVIDDICHDRPASPEPNEFRRRAFACLGDLLARFSQEHSVLIFIDDFQWADKDSYDLFRSLIDSASTRQVTFLLSHRPDAAPLEEEESGLSELAKLMGDRPSTRFIELAPLRLGEVQRLTAALLKEQGSDAARLVRSVVDEAEGSPFFVHELTRHVLRDSSNGGAALTLERVMAERLDGLPDSSRKLLRLIAVSEDPLSQSVLSSAGDLSTASGTWNEALFGLTDAGLIRRHGLRRKDSVEVYHDRIRQAVYREVGAGRPQLHRELAEALELEPGTQAGLLVRHWIGAGEPERAQVHMLRAIDDASTKMAFGHAARLYRMALELEKDTAARSALFKGLGDSLANVGRPKEAAEAYLGGVKGASVASRLELQNLAAGKLLQGGYITEGIEALRGVLALVGIRLPSSPPMVLASVVYQQMMLRLEGLAFQERELAEIDRDQLLRLDVLRSAATGFSVVDTIRGADFQIRALRGALEAGEISRISETLAQHGAYSAGLGGRHIAKGREAVARSAALAKRVGDPRLVAIAAGSLGMIEFWSGKWDLTVSHFAESERLLMSHCHGVHWELATARMFLGLGLMRLGEMRELGERYDVHVTHALQMGDHFGAAGLKTRHNVIWLARDEPMRAMEELEGALSTWPAGSFHIQHFWALFATCERLLYEDRAEDAQQVMSDGTHPLRRSLLTRVQMVRAEASELQGRLCLALAAEESNEQRRSALIRKARGFARSLLREEQGFAAAWGALIHAGADWLTRPEYDPSTLDGVIDQFTEARCHLYAAAVRRRRGELTSGESGRALVERADAWMRSKGVVDPIRMTRMLTPAYRGAKNRRAS